MFIKKKIWEEQFHTTERKEIKINPNTYGKPYFIDSRAVYNITKSGWYFFGRGPYFVKVLSKVPYNELLNEFMSETYHKSKSYRRPLARKPIEIINPENIVKPADIQPARLSMSEPEGTISRGGSSELDNLGICTKKANQMKSDMTPDELISMCKLILIHHGYTINKELIVPNG